MKNENAVRDKSYAFALRIVELHRFLTKDKSEFVLSNRLLKGGTSRGANIEEAVGGQSERDFTAKLSIAYKEARESHYWIRLLRDSRYLSEKQSESLLGDCEELLKPLGSSLHTLRKKHKRERFIDS